MKRKVDSLTKLWIRNRSDEIAVEHGCRFNEERGLHAMNFFREFLHFYEGEYAGEPFNPLPWQEDLLMRAYGWERYSTDWNRYVRRFRKISVWVPKKNGKSPIAAGNGLYLLTYDGEQGQKVFSSARDGKQAGIVHTHARMMVNASPRLSAECRINKSTGRISHGPTNSFYDILAGDNIKGQEGLNGSVIIDETHVVDDRLAKVLEYMGASRSEPMQWEFSTAGDDPDGYGRKQYDYGKAVEAGSGDDQFLFVCYEAPQNVTDSEIENNPEIWKAANPSWGRTIKEEEFRSSLQRARKSLSDWITFKRYRLNIWATSTNPWLMMDKWQQCRRQFTETDLLGLECWAGLDLSQTQDMSALALVFRGDSLGEYKVLPYFWLPEKVAEERGHLATFKQWAAEGYLELTPGDTIDYRYIKRRVIDVCSKFFVRNLLFDKTYAEQLTQEISEETGIKRTVFPQTMMNFAGPTAGFERAVIAGNMHHNGHPILTWQVANVQVRSDANGNKRPVKPPHSDVRKIDGVVAAIQAFAGVEERESVYETREMLAI